MKGSQILKHPLFIAIATGVVVILFEKLFPVVFYWILNFLIWLFTYTIEFPLWVISLLGIITLIFISKEVFSTIKDLQKPDYLSYKVDVFDGARWRWKYLSHGEIDRDSLKPFCIHDETPLILQNKPFSQHYSKQLFCETCGFVSDDLPENADALLNKILRMIEREIRQKYPDIS